MSVAADSQISPRWQTTVRFGSTNQDRCYTNPSPTGETFDPFGFGGNYLGRTVTLEGADGRTVTGQGILDYGGVYPQAYPGRTTRRSLFGQVTFQATQNLAVSGRRPLRARGQLRRSRSRSLCDAQQRRRVRRRTCHAGQPRLHQRRYRRRTQRGVRDGIHAASVRGGLSSQSLLGADRRDEGHDEHRQGHQGAERVPGRQLAVRAG